MIVDLWFPVLGETAPADHAYPLFSAISHRVQALHEDDTWGLHTLVGQRVGPGLLQLPRRPRLGLRLPADRIPLALGLAGAALDVGGHTLRLGTPRVCALEPSGTLVARTVTIKGYTEPEPTLARVRVELDRLGVVGRAEIGPRRVVRVHERAIVGFGVKVHELSAEHSVLLQSVGVGGRRKLGCGLFRSVAEGGLA